MGKEPALMGNELRAPIPAPDRPDQSPARGPDRGTVPADLDALFGRVPSLAGSPRSVELLPGGLTNRNYKVSTPAGVFVARVFSRGSELLAIDRDHEYRNTRAAAAAGAGPPVIDYRPADGLLVIGYIAGRTLSDADVAAPGNLARIARACRRLHAGPPFGNDFDMFEIQRGYREVARARGFRLPAGYDSLLPHFEAVRQALAARPHRAVPCNNDLLAGNFVDDGERIWLIDYEYSGNNDPCFELGNIWSECALPAGGLEELVTGYYGRRLRNKIARARLLGLVAKYGWTLWGCIQAAASPLDFDFWSWGMERYKGAVAGFTSRDFATLLDDVQRAG
jgi:thiamine kinase-like enzyme